MNEFTSLINLDVWTALFTLCNSVLIFFVLKKKLFQPVLKMIDDRQKEIDTIYEDANTAKKEAEELRSSYSAMLADANSQRERILSDATRQAQLREEEIIRDAQAQAARTLDRAQEMIALEKKQAMQDLKDEVSDIAVDIASAVLQEDVDGNKHSRLIDSFIESLG